MIDDITNEDVINDTSQIDRIQTFVDDKILDSIGWIADSLDKIQQGLTYAIGGVGGEVGKRIKKESSTISRKIAYVTKLADGLIQQVPVPPTVPPQWPVPPTDPHTPKDQFPDPRLPAPRPIPYPPPVPPQRPPVEPPIFPPVPPRPPLPRPPVPPQPPLPRPPVPPQPPPPVPDPHVEKSCPTAIIRGGDDWTLSCCSFTEIQPRPETTNFAEISGYICGQMNTNSNINFWDKTWADGIIGDRRKLVWFADTSMYYDERNTYGENLEFASTPPQVVTVPMARNSEGHISIYTDDGENLFREKYMDTDLRYRIKSSTTYNDFADAWVKVTDVAESKTSVFAYGDYTPMETI